MLFRFTLTHDILGSLEINEPDGWKDCKIKLERDKNFRSLVEYFEGDFIFYGSNGIVDGGLDFIKEVEQAYGVDATIEILIEVSFDGYSFEELFTGQLNLEGIQEMPDNRVQIPIIRDDFWAKFISRLETPVDIQSVLSLDGEVTDMFDSMNLRMQSQKVRQQFYGKVSSFALSIQTSEIGDYIQWSPDNISLDEIKEKFSIPSAVNTVLPVNIFTMELGGEYRFISQMSTHRAYDDLVPGDNLIMSDAYIELYLQVNDDTPLPFSFVNSGVLGYRVDLPTYEIRITTWSIDETITLLPGDFIRVYALIIDADGGLGTALRFVSDDGRSNFGGVQLSDFITGDPSWLNIISDTIYPETNSFGFFLHDAAGQIADRIISRDQSFYSEHLGSDKTLYRQYDSDGCAWKYTLIKGLQLRQYSLLEKPFFLSFKQWWEGANPILCLGLGYETINGVQVIRVEKLEDFYDDSSTSLDISNVRQITRLYDSESIFKTVKIGYKKWQSEDVSGIDDPQTKRTYATRFKKVGKEISIESEFIAASLAIETTRRKTKEKSADYKFDDETFIIAINPIPVDVSPETSPDVTDYSPELDENFTSVTNLLNSETRYNLRITPARNLIRWIKYLSGCLQSYIGSTFKFTAGEGNYDMISDMSNVSDGCDEFKPSIGESEDVPVYADPLHLALAYEIVVPLEWEEYILIRENRKKAIGISQTTVNHTKFFIESLDYELVKGVATIKAWPAEYVDILVVESSTASRTCIPTTVETCDDAYLTENSFEYETENGDCLILN